MSYYKFFFLALLIGVSFAFYYIIYPFFLAIVFALILAHFFKKPYKYFRKRFSENIASLFSMGLVIVVIVIPFLIVTVLLSVEARRGYGQAQKIIGTSLEEIQSNLEKNDIYKQIKKNPEMIKQVSSIFFDQQAEDINQLFQQASVAIKGALSILFKGIQVFFLNITNLLLNFFIMLYMLYFFFKEGDNVLQQIKNFIPMEGVEIEELLNEAFKIIDATIIGMLIIGIMEGTYGGLLFYLQGVPSPVTWGVIMMVLSMLPVVGTNSLLVPLAIYRIVTGDYIDAIIVLVIGGGGILVSQNIIKPKLVGDRSGLHPALIVLSTLGGIFAMGIIGFLIGPIVATIFVVFWKLFRKKNIVELPVTSEGK